MLLTVIRGIGGRGQNAVERPAVRSSSPRPSRVRVDDCVLGERLFKDTLVRERKRADRFGTPLAVLVVDRSDHSSEGCHWLSTLRAVSAVKRDAEVVGWLEQGAVLGLLLPEASRKGALKVMYRLRREISKRLGESALAALSVRVYTHGVQPGPDGAALPPVDLLLDAFVPQRKQPWRDGAKRGLDILGSLALLTVFAPVLLAVFAAVKWTSPGPALLKQVRIGRRGKPFAMLKFRSMYVNAGHGIHQDYMAQFIKSSGHQARNGNEVFKLTNDPRITPPGGSSGRPAWTSCRSSGTCCGATCH